MATNTKQAKQEALNLRNALYNDYMARWCSLFNNSITIKNLPPSVPKRYLLRELRNKGSIAFCDRIIIDNEITYITDGLYLPYAGSGIDRYGMFTHYQLYGANGFTTDFMPADDVVILRANDLSYPVSHTLELYANKLVDIDMAIRQNIDQLKVMSICQVPDQSTLLTLTNLYEAKQLGATIAYAAQNPLTINALSVIPTGAEYHINELQEARKTILDEALAVIGITTANTDKRERVQGIEVLASTSYAQSMIDMLVETFNHDAEVGGLSIRLRANNVTLSDTEEENQTDTSKTA